jgi:peptide methionine sulfoxide reductase MsrB
MASDTCGAGPSAPEGLSAGCVGAPLRPGQKLPIRGEESIMSAKAHGTAATPVRANLRWNCDPKLADRICCFNRHYAEHSGYWESTSFLDEVDRKGETSFYDSVSGDLLFVAPRNRSFADFLAESRSHGWPSFRDEEVNWSFVRVLDDGECVSVSGTHLGHNLPDRKGNRYCINLVSVAAKN